MTQDLILSYMDFSPDWKYVFSRAPGVRQGNEATARKSFEQVWVWEAFFLEMKNGGRKFHGISGNFHFQRKFPFPVQISTHWARPPTARRDLRRSGRPRGGMCQWRCSGPSGGLHGLRRPRGGGHGTGMSALLFRLYDLELALLHVHVHVVISRNRKRYMVMTNADTKLFIYELLWMSR